MLGRSPRLLVLAIVVLACGEQGGASSDPGSGGSPAAGGADATGGGGGAAGGGGGGSGLSSCAGFTSEDPPAAALYLFRTDQSAVVVRDLSLAAGDEFELYAAALTRIGAFSYNLVEWATSDPAVVSAEATCEVTDQLGHLRALAPGTATVTATVRNIPPAPDVSATVAVEVQ